MIKRIKKKRDTRKAGFLGPHELSEGVSGIEQRSFIDAKAFKDNSLMPKKAPKAFSNGSSSYTPPDLFVPPLISLLEKYLKNNFWLLDFSL